MSGTTAADWAERTLAWLRRCNYGIALIVGAGLLGCAAFVLADILLRQIGRSFGGTDEISGYTMAIASSWGMAYTMLELGHVRIDLLRARLATLPRLLLDVLALAALSATVCVIAWRSWPVLEKSLINGSRANTPLETPLWLVQLPWLAGWVWFAVSALATLIAALVLILAGRWRPVEAAIGSMGEAAGEMDPSA